ncbi:hypothetical protein [Flavobacterium psychrophilum]|nr:hypothetical protein [Flavobacterium psychrophilum]EKT4549076.1 hypothetical protein [Flavobacterium psychrophilum]ELM3644985.1 hypothetical protein [Flavobacterium psychrophilum]ELV7525531.1 hypothetical protein [Flavobacterium psychrophilum]
MMLLTASFTFANTKVEVRTLEVIVPPTTKVVVKTEASKPSTDDKMVCYSSEGNMGCGPTLYDAIVAYHAACHC